MFSNLSYVVKTILKCKCDNNNICAIIMSCKLQYFLLRALILNGLVTHYTKNYFSINTQ